MSFSRFAAFVAVALVGIWSFDRYKTHEATHDHEGGLAVFEKPSNKHDNAGSVTSGNLNFPNKAVRGGIKISSLSNVLNSIPSSSSELDEPAMALNNSSYPSEVVSCNQSCKDTRDFILFPFELTDNEYEQALADVDSLATLLRNDDSLLAEFIELATYTSGNKRSLIIEAFALLGKEERQSLGMALSQSTYRAQRHAGIQLLASPENMDAAHVQIMSDILAQESDVYIQSTAIKALNQPDKFKGEQAVIDALSQVVYAQTDNTLKGEALLASVQLTQYPDDMLVPSIDAIRSGHGEYQYYGARALEAIAHSQMTSANDISWQLNSDIQTLVEEVMNPEYDNLDDEVRKIIDELYYQHRN